MTLGEFHTMVRDIIKRGDRLDAQIVAKTREAARFIEQNFSMKYMEQYKTFQLDSEAGEPRFMPIPSSRLKAFIFIKLFANEEWRDVVQRDPRGMAISQTAGIPSEYFLQGKTGMWLNCPPADDYDGQLMFHEYTEWPTDEDTDDIWLIEHAQEALLAQTILKMIPILRDPTMKAEYEAVWQSSIKTLLLAESDLMDSNKSETMNYGVDYAQLTTR